MASKSKTLAELLNGDVTVDATDIADGSVTSAKLDTNITIAGNFDVSSGTIKLDGNYPVGTANVALGDTALDDGSLSGSNNTAIGSAAMTAHTSGNNNTAVGHEALTANTTGFSNVTVGGRSLDANISGAQNTALGYQALSSNSTANNNTAVGFNSLSTNTTGTLNTAVGKGALQSSTASDNTAVGAEALEENVTGTNNTAVGRTALAENISGNYNTAVGRDALLKNTASYNTGLGYEAGFTNQVGQWTTAIGSRALYSNTANYNTAVGGGALFDNTTGTNNVAVGGTNGAYSALRNNTSGASNTAIGNAALAFNDTASNNTAVGYAAGYSLTNAGGQTGRNTFIGMEAGYNSNGDINTFVGQGSGSQITSGRSNTIIGRFTGNEGGLDIRTSNNNIVLSDGDGNISMKSDSSRRVIIPGYGGGNNEVYNANASLSVWKDATTTRVLHVQNKQNSSGAEAYRSVLRSNANNTSSYHFIATIEGTGDRFYLYGNGNVANSNNSYGGISDIKLKENITDASSQWDDIKAVQVKKYSWIADDLDVADQIGVIAQDLEASGMSGLVSNTDDKDEDGEFTGTVTKSVKYSVLYMKAIKALQESMDRIETLEAKVAALEAN